MLILHDPSTLLHSTVELLGAKLIPALESPERITAILESISPSHHALQTINFHVPDTDDTRDNALPSLLSATHDASYLKHLSSIFQTWLKADLVDASSSVLPECFPFPTSLPHRPSEPKDIYARVGYYAFDMSSGITQSTCVSVLASANLALQGVKLLLAQASTSPSTILALTRPPGHHCDGARCGGYCYINNAALAVTAYCQHISTGSTASTKNLKPKTAILDLDFHHGNGTQSIFYTDPSVLYVSIHGQDEFPYYTGSASETGSGEGVGFNLNLPLATDSTFPEYEKLLDVALQRIKEYEGGELLIVSLGFDTFELDPLGKFKIGTEDYETMARKVRGSLMVGENGKGMGMGKALILLEGGYVIDRLGENLLSFLKGWEEG